MPRLLYPLLFTGALTPLCGAAAPSPGGPAAPGDAPKLRLPDTVRPVRCSLDLKLLPDREEVTGTVRIDVEVRRPTAVIWLHGSDLTVEQALVEKGPARLEARPEMAEGGFLGLRLERAVSPGPARLTLRYRAKASEEAAAGVFRRQEGKDWYCLTQFEPLDARRAFPCFDEPRFKIPWQITLRVRRGDVAVSNAPIREERRGSDGLRTVRFAETRPLPTYLVAFAAGPFDVVDLGKVGRKRTPMRILTSRGKRAEARYAARALPQLLVELERYFGIPYPYEKLDHLATPIDSGFFGAMENAGLIVYDGPAILAPPEEETSRFRRACALVAAHEMAHHWFGNLVTMPWWDDIWLNEAFATWMESKIVDRWQPEWNRFGAQQAQRKSAAMGGDRLASARRIREPIHSADDILNAFDGITYAKGAALIEMVEDWLGETTFRAGVRRYLTERAWGSATSHQFISALSRAAGRDLGPMLGSFLDQNGTPLVTAELKQNAGAPVRLRLTQSRYLPLGSTARGGSPWIIPVRVRYEQGGRSRAVSLLLDQKSEEIRLGSARPRWVLVNEGQRGYYRVRYGGDLLQRLVNEPGARLSAPERVGLTNDLSALVQSGGVDAGEALRLLPALLRNAPAPALGVSVGLVSSLTRLVPDPMRPRWAQFVRELYGPRARALGWRAPAPPSREDEETSRLRPTLPLVAAEAGQDPVLREQARRLVEKWLARPSSAPPDEFGPALRVVARFGDRALFQRLRQRALKASNDRERSIVLSALAAFQDPELQQESLALMLDESVPGRSLPPLLFGRTDENAESAYAFLKEHYDAISARLPEDLRSFLLRIPGRFGDEERARDVETSFRERAANVPGGRRILTQTVESIRLAAAFRARQQASVERFLAAPANGSSKEGGRTMPAGTGN